jgi:glycosyltransferase involved in cell wall biosynthesis
MKFGFFVPHFSEGGLERSTLRLADEVVRQGGEALLITLRDNGRMLSMWPGSDSVRALGRRSAFMSIPSLARLLRKEDLDVLISAQDHANVAAVLARKLSRKETPLILTERVSMRAAMGARGWFRRKTLGRLIAYAYPRADVVLANSEAGAREIESVLNWPTGGAVTIYNPTADESISELAKEAVDNPWFVGGEIPVIVGMGRLVEQKDFATLIRAFSVVRNIQECRLVIFGDGPLRGDLERQTVELGISNDVLFESFVENPFKYLSRSATFVVSSKFEGLPNALIEAQVCGVPTVSTDCPTGPLEILQEGRAGALVPVGDYQAMASAIEGIIADPALAEKYVRAATVGLDRFRPTRCYSQYVELIEQVRSL